LALTERVNTGLGWRPDLPDFRDEVYDRPKLKLGLFGPKEPDAALVPGFATRVPKYNQLHTNSCTGNAVSALMTYVRGVTPRSRLQIYYEARRIIGETDRDEGAYIRDCIKVISNLGAGREDWWPFREDKVLVDPPLNVDRDALMRRVFRYQRLDGGSDYRHCLAQGRPFVIGFSVYDHFMGGLPANYGIVTMPDPTQKLAGGHAVCVIGYDKNFRSTEWAKSAVAKGYPADQIPEQVYIVRNSWGAEWGHNGDFAIDMRYFDSASLANDAWTIFKA
jgi:hypothetical protein